MQLNRYNLSTVGNGVYWIEWIENGNMIKAPVHNLMVFLDQIAENSLHHRKEFVNMFNMAMAVDSTHFLNSKYTHLFEYMDEDLWIPIELDNKPEALKIWQMTKLMKAYNAMIPEACLRYEDVKDLC